MSYTLFMVKYSICKNTNVPAHCSTHTPVGRLATGKDVIKRLRPSTYFLKHYGQHGGAGHCITGFDEGRYNGIFSGLNNLIAEYNFSFIGGGAQNYINGSFNAIGGGCLNCIPQGQYNVLGGGDNNTISNPTPGTNEPLYSVIVGGQLNCIDTDVLNDTVFATIGGGHNNYIAPGAYNTAILGGDSNSLTGSCSAILGGANNNDNGFAYTGMYGVGLGGANIPSGTGALWANELVVPDIPMGTLSGGIPVPPGGYPSRALWFYPDANGNNVVYVV